MPSDPLFYVVIFLAFVFFLIPQTNSLQAMPSVIVLVLAVLFHEAGHMLGMWVFGFQNVKMYFIPFLGAVTSGRPVGAAPWKHALVSLLGPVPGLILGFAGLLRFSSYPTTIFLTAIQTLLFLNVFNLLPFGGLDGGRFLQTVIFSRHRFLAAVFAVLGAVALMLVAVRLGAPMLALFALLGLFALPVRWRILKAAAAVRAPFRHLEADAKKLSDPGVAGESAPVLQVLRLRSVAIPKPSSGTICAGESAPSLPSARFALRLRRSKSFRSRVARRAINSVRGFRIILPNHSSESFFRVHSPNRIGDWADCESGNDKPA
jgi:Zn-dependent protease